MKKVLLVYAILLLVVFSLILGIRRYLFGKHTESFTFDATVATSSYESAPPNINYLEVYHDGNAVALVTIEQAVFGTLPYPIGTQIGLILNDFERFGGSTFKQGRYRLTLDKYVEHDNF